MFECIKDKKVLITGATGGIGSHLAVMFAECGASVGVHHNRSIAKANQIVREIEKKGGSGAPFQSDLT